MSPDTPSRDWQDLAVSARVAVDQEFHDRVQESDLSGQSWELVMSAVEFQIDTVDGDPEIVPVHDNLESVLPTIESIESSQGGGGSGGIGSWIASLLGRGSSPYRDTAEALTTEYATALQTRLEESGQWAAVLDAANSEPSNSA